MQVNLPLINNFHTFFFFYDSLVSYPRLHRGVLLIQRIPSLITCILYLCLQEVRNEEDENSNICQQTAQLLGFQFLAFLIHYGYSRFLRIQFCSFIKRKKRITPSGFWNKFANYMFSISLFVPLWLQSNAFHHNSGGLIARPPLPHI